MTNLSNLPQRQREVLHYIVRHIEDKGESPTIEEISAGVDILPQQVTTCLDALEEKKKIRRMKFKHRSIEVLSIMFLFFCTPVAAETFQIGDAINVDVTATVNNAAVIETRIVGDKIEATLNGEPQPYTVIEEEAGEITILLTGE